MNEINKQEIYKSNNKKNKDKMEKSTLFQGQQSRLNINVKPFL